jgi:hypothetical protein
VDDKALCQQAVYLRNAAPDQYQAFVNELEKLATKAATVLVTSKPESFMSDQGWAKCSLFLLRSLKECDARVHEKKPTAETPSR